jgi:hypothetical protein
MVGSLYVMQPGETRWQTKAKVLKTTTARAKEGCMMHGEFISCNHTVDRQRAEPIPYILFSLTFVRRLS